MKHDMHIVAATTLFQSIVRAMYTSTATCVGPSVDVHALGTTAHATLAFLDTIEHLCVVAHRRAFVARAACFFGECVGIVNLVCGAQCASTVLAVRGEIGECQVPFMQVVPQSRHCVEAAVFDSVCSCGHADEQTYTVFVICCPLYVFPRGLAVSPPEAPLRHASEVAHVNDISNFGQLV